MSKILNTADNGSYNVKGGNVLTVHYTENAIGTPYARVKTLCGQAKRKNHFGVHAVPREVNCRKCLEA